MGANHELPTGETSDGHDLVVGSTVDVVSAAEINQQIATARRYPRSITTFMREARAMVTLNESIAQQCIYALPRDGKTIEGPSARFAEIVAHAWGNSRAGARVVNEGQEFITAQGVMHDLEKNVAITFEVQRRITNSKGVRYKADMIGVTGNAASSIALRNAILKAVPKAFWEPLYQEARKVVAGDVKTLANKRADAIQQFAIFGVTQAQILAKLGRNGIADVTVDDLVTLFGILTAIKEGDTTPEEAFSADDNPTTFTVESKPKAPAAAAAEKPAAAEQGAAEATPASAAATSTTTTQSPPPPPPPPADDQPKQAGTVMASDGQVKYLANKAKALKVSLEEMAAEQGVTDLTKLSLDGFNVLKAELARLEKAGA